MQELVGRLTALDPQASETLKVVSYFDALVSGGVGAETIVRGAAALSGVPAGLRTRSGSIRVAPSGDRLGGDSEASDAAWPAVVLADGSVAWIERVGTPHANDAMVLERFVLAVSVTQSRRRSDRDDAVAVAIDAARPPDERAAAVRRLGLTPDERVRVIATSPAEAAPEGFSTVVALPHGAVRATIVREDRDPTGRVGRGGWSDGPGLPSSWMSASVALRLTTDHLTVVDAEDLGVLIDVVRTIDLAGRSHPDVERLSRLDARSQTLLRTLAEAESVRAAAVALGMHHSTLQARHETLTRDLGYDPRSPLGRARYEIAELLRRSG